MGVHGLISPGKPYTAALCAIVLYSWERHIKIQTKLLWFVSCTDPTYNCAKRLSSYWLLLPAVTVTDNMSHHMVCALIGASCKLATHMQPENKISCKYKLVVAIQACRSICKVIFEASFCY